MKKKDSESLVPAVVKSYRTHVGYHDHTRDEYSGPSHLIIHLSI